MIAVSHKSPTSVSERRASSVHSALANYDFSGSRYSSEARIDAAANFLVTGNVAQVSRLTGIPETTLSGWRKSDWWVKLVADLRREYDEELDGKLTGCLHRAVDALFSGIDSGDEVLVRGKDGSHSLRQKPVSSRDLAVITGIVYDKRALLRRMPTSIREDRSKDRLEAMAARFEKIAESYRAGQAKVVNDQ